eukprot:TRINITY_DN1270_c0_g1_i1.p1 TRINITY_DN1270_c0_g1~~TRINITY_DN1270_c0_g1_i1.p1  ORF type:complete len:135 (+),score=35.66 TRINITY_DN1270_c0_g1_i1:126-530(+)
MVTVVVGIDDSGYGIFAFQRALRIVKEGDTLYLLTVIDRKKGLIAKENKKTFRKICLEKKVNCISLDETGDVREVMSRVCDEVGADVLVLGSRGQGSLRRVFVGSTTDYCLRFVNCSVLVAKKPASHRDAIPYF